MKLAKSLLIITSFFYLYGSHAGLYQINSKWDKLDFKVCFLDDPQALYRKELAFSFETKEIIIRKASLFKKEIRERVSKTAEEERILAFPEKYKSNIREVVKQSYEKTGLGFTGWSNCSKNSNVDLIFVFSDVQYPYLATGVIGDPAKDQTLKNKKINSIRINSGFFAKEYNLFYQIFSELSERHKLNLDIENLSQEWALKELLSGVVHEIGHFLGLEHEHMIKAGYEEMKSVDLSPNFKIYNKIISDNRFLDLLDKMAKQDSYTSLRQIGLYDPFSSMSYIWQGIHPSLAKVDAYCQFYLQDELCDNHIIDFLSLTSVADRSFLSPYDVMVLRNIYYDEALSLTKNDYEDVIFWIEKNRNRILNL
jgi:predicted Zn-dependent protease